ncbi:MAG: RNA polymerase sigma factor, partial [Candidatus Magasanikbacteria bacterium]|nr:RNA polymerase sigma factor [Candidatus Magasanikbacteria bacterium]
DEKFDLNEHIDNKQMREKISEGLSELKEKYREPLILYYFEQKSYEEISDILRLPRNTVGVLIMRGKEKLKESFKNLEV